MDIREMDIADIVNELNQSTVGSERGIRGWELQVFPRSDGTVRFGVSGNVLPFRANGQRYSRGQEPFHGDEHADVFEALRSGLVDMRLAQESRR